MSSKLNATEAEAGIHSFEQRDYGKPEEPMMTLAHLMQELELRHVELAVVGGALKYRAPRPLPSEILGALSERKSSLMGLVNRGSSQTFIPLSPPQRHLWALSRMSSDRGGELAYVDVMALHVAADLDRRALERAARAVLSRHQSLRAEIERDGQTQSILSECDERVEYLKSGETITVQEALELVADELAMSRGLSVAPQLRVAVAKVQDGTVIAFVAHHAVFDGTSFRLVQHEFATFYNAELNGTSVSLPCPGRFADYVAIRAQLRQTQKAQSDRRYWTQHLQPVYANGPQPHTARTYRGERTILHLCCSWEQLCRFSASLGVTPFVPFRVACQQAVAQVAGKGVAGWGPFAVDYRAFARSPNTVGYCSEVFPLLIQDTDSSFVDQCKQVHGLLFAALGHHAWSLPDFADDCELRLTQPLFASTLADFSELSPYAGRTPRLIYPPAPYRDVFNMELHRHRDGLVVCGEFSTDTVHPVDAAEVFRLVVRRLEQQVLHDCR